MNKRGSLHLLAEAYKQVGKQVIAEEQAPLLQPVKGRYIYFVDGNELFQLKPYKQIEPEGMIMAMANNWTKETVMQGEDVKEILGIEVKDTSSWYIVNNAPSDHTFVAYIGTAGIKKFNEAETPRTTRMSKERDVFQACIEYVKSMRSNDDMSQYLKFRPEKIYNIAFELTHDDMVSDSDMADDDMADAELDSEEVAVKACEGIAKYMMGAMLFSITPEQSFDLVYSIARRHMPN